MRLTHFGVKALLFYAAIVGAYYAAPYVNLFFLLLAFLSIQWCLTTLWTWKNVRRISAEIGDPPPVAAGTAARVEGTVHAEQRTRFDIEVSLRLESGERAIGRVPVLRESASVAIDVPPLPRGVHRVEATTLGSTYPLGLLRRTRSVRGPAEIVVHPRPAAIAESASRTAEDLVRELMGSSMHGAGDLQPSGLREHRDGDALRSVHWRASARRGRLVVREWEGGLEQGLEVVLDRRCEAAELEEALSELAAIVVVARESKEVLGLRTQGTSATFGDGHEPWSAALRLLAEAQPLPEDAPAPPAASPSVLRLPRRELARA
ncbi:MAG: DUF58 domain-containing protein [Planctomycetota bacterium]